MRIKQAHQKFNSNDYALKQWMMDALANQLDNIGRNIFGSKQPTARDFRVMLRPIALGIIASELHLVCEKSYRNGGLKMKANGHSFKSINRVWEKMDNSFLNYGSDSQKDKFWEEAYTLTYEEF
jgi:hypothetical protein